MKLKENVLVIIIASVVVGLTIFFALQIGGKNSQSKVNQQANQSQGQSMASHHGTGTVNSQTFDNLVGKVAPGFTLKDSGGNSVSMDSLKGKKVVLFFNEGLMCYPACWNQIVAFAQDKRFSDKNALVFSIIVDSKNNWQKALQKMPELSLAKVLFDTDSSASSSYGVLSLPSSMHLGTYPGHSYVIANERGIVTKVLDDPQMAIRNDEMISSL